MRIFRDMFKAQLDNPRTEDGKEVQMSPLLLLMLIMMMSTEAQHEGVDGYVKEIGDRKDAYAVNEEAVEAASGELDFFLEHNKLDEQNEGTFRALQSKLQKAITKANQTVHDLTTFSRTKFDPFVRSKEMYMNIASEMAKVAIEECRVSAKLRPINKR